MLIRGFEMCEGFSQMQRDEYPFFAAMAAEGDHYQHSHEWILYLNQHNRREQFPAYERFLKQGWIDTALGMSMHYQDIEDWTSAFAFMLIFAKADEVRSHSVPLPVRTTGYESILSSIASHLTPQEQLEAEALAGELLRSNKRCCRSAFH